MSTLGRRIVLPLLVAAALGVAGHAPSSQAATAPSIETAVPAFLAPAACPAPRLFSAAWEVVAQPVEGEPVPIDPHAICNCNTNQDCQGLKCRSGVAATCLIALACDNGYVGSCRCP